MNGLRRGYRRPETSRYRELFFEKYIRARPRRDWLGTIHWERGTDPQPERKREPLDPGILILIVLLVMIACFAAAVVCALPLQLLKW